MDGGATLLCALLLAHTGREAAAITLTKDSSSDFLVGRNIILSISYETGQNPSITWKINDTVLVLWSQGISRPDPKYSGRLNVTDNGSLLISNSTKNDSGNYTVSASVPGQAESSVTFPVKIYDPVTNASVWQSPDAVDEGTPAVNLTCSAASGAVTYTWTRDGQPLLANGSYVTSDGGKTLQISRPNRSYSGSYSCNVSNPVDWKSATRMLNVSYSDAAQSLSGGAIAGIVIGSVFGALLLITLIVLVIFCIRKRRKGKKEKTPAAPHKEAIRTVSGTTLSPDDPAYFTLNNIMYRSSSISMGSYIMNSGDNTSDRFENSSPSFPPSQPKVKHATQV
ncbi:carcinoembryonic antigen-related cell adhesion molecule 2-like [Bufo gargarizans]|uniref:carcinoembryonic antigen-related cell adhesion molecule 2-like n=1 Tax=Bufo gargarizans TaxID=30331 RepID=UPI001CF4BE9E|nr:carcinoembryonic antigen-related cell adhesion molecule 2-like [Bufo gargarizans]